MTHRATLIVLTSLAILVLPGRSLSPAAWGQTGEGSAPNTEPGAQTPETSADLDLPADEVQAELQELGFYEGEVDGQLGPQTREAIAAFQEDAGFIATGQPDLFTRQQIEASARAETTTSEPPPGSPSAVQSPLFPDADPDSIDAEASEEPAPAEAADAQPESDAEAEAEPTAPPRSRRSSLLLLGGVSVVAVLSFGGGMLLASRRRPSKAAAAPVGATAATPAPGLAGGIDGRRTSATDSPSPDDTIGIPPGNSALAVEEPSKLAKVNIVDELVQDLRTGDPGKRHHAIWELGERGNSSAIQPMVELLMDADSKERGLILASLSEIGIRTLKPMNRALALSLQDQNPEVRQNAIRDMTRLYEQLLQTSQMLAHVSEDGDEDVRQTARWALNQLNRMRPIMGEAPQRNSLSPEE
jgi:peptidoglycan hydrolase-like protein with peptidoglycan-binding domain